MFDVIGYILLDRISTDRKTTNVILYILIDTAAIQLQGAVEKNANFTTTASYHE
jgi:hypothetical protein